MNNELLTLKLAIILHFVTFLLQKFERKLRAFVTQKSRLCSFTLKYNTLWRVIFLYLFLSGFNWRWIHRKWRYSRKYNFVSRLQRVQNKSTTSQNDKIARVQFADLFNGERERARGRKSQWNAVKLSTTVRTQITQTAEKNRERTEKSWSFHESNQRLTFCK